MKMNNVMNVMKMNTGMKPTMLMKTAMLTTNKDVRKLNSIRRMAPVYRLTANIKEASPEESAEILAMIDSLTEDDRQIASVHHFCLDLSD